MTQELEPQTPRERMLYEWGIFNGLGQADYLLQDFDTGDTLGSEVKEMRYLIDDMRQKRGIKFAEAAKAAADA